MRVSGSRSSQKHGTRTPVDRVRVVLGRAAEASNAVALGAVSTQRNGRLLWSLCSNYVASCHGTCAS